MNVYDVRRERDRAKRESETADQREEKTIKTPRRSLLPERPDSKLSGIIRPRDCPRRPLMPGRPDLQVARDNQAQRLSTETLIPGRGQSPGGERQSGPEIVHGDP